MSSLGMTIYPDGNVAPNKSKSPTMNRGGAKSSRYKSTGDGRYSVGVSPRPEARSTRNRLAQQAEAVARYLWPDGKVVNGEWRIGNVQGDTGQSLGVILTGPKAGQWKDFDTGEGGDLLDAWMAAYGVTLSQSVRDASVWLGMAVTDPVPVARAKAPKSVKTLLTVPDGVDGVTRFIYTDKDGHPVMCSRRVELGGGKKRFELWGRTADGSGWQQNLDHAPCLRPMYRLSEIIGSALPVIFHEGEKAVEAAISAKLHGTHTTTSNGAASPAKSDFGPCKGLEVVICPDNDEPGEKYAAKVSWLAMDAGASSVRVFNLPGLPPKGDVVEWLELGGTPEQWSKLLASAEVAMPDADKEAVSNDEWPGPIALPAGLLPVSAFDGNLLPDSLRPYVMDVAERMQCPPDFPAIAVIVSLATLVGRNCGINPKAHDDWLVVPNLWGAAVGRPSLMKSPALEQGMRPLGALIAKAGEDYKKELAKYEGELELFTGQKKAWKSTLQKAGKDGLDAHDLLGEVPQAPDHPKEIRYRTNAGSTECLIKLLNENPNGLLLFRDELVGWLKSLEKSGKEGDRQFFMEAWNGSGASFDYDTFTHGHMHCESLCLSILGSIQPGPLSRIVAAAGKGGGGDDGLVQRFQLFVYPDAGGKWRNVDKWPDTPARQKLNTLFGAIKKMPFPSPEEEGIVPSLHFTAGGQVVFDGWRERLETQIQQEDDPMLEAHLAKYRSLMPSLALLFHLAKVADMGVDLTPVTKGEAIRAVAWCDYLETHARRIYGMGKLTEVEGAKGLLKHLVDGDIELPFTAREIYRKGWSRLSTPDEVDVALSLLEDHHWVTTHQIQTGPRGGRPTATYLMNPKAMGGGQ